MVILIVFSLLFFSELSYFYIASRFNIIDKPNERSLHSTITIRGGGILFTIAVLQFFIYSDFKYSFFVLGLTGVTIISFLDDIFTLPNRYRLPFQFFAILMILIELNVLVFYWPIILGLLILGVGIMNAYNFMDGINGMTGGYSLAILTALSIVNHFHIEFIENDFLYFILLSVVIFNFFNFRTKAKCFAGDVGSISIAVIILFLIGKVSLIDQNPIYFLFLAVYGVDSILTIIHRLILKENIFKAHRLHLFQVIVHQQQVPHLVMSSIYALVQFFICIILIKFLNESIILQWSIGVGIVVVLILVYLFIKKHLKMTKN
jgi:UDP-GlcNAc:undecaprenyl-phosphate GlcNAc-1-phosphate transferase